MDIKARTTKRSENKLKLTKGRTLRLTYMNAIKCMKKIPGWNCQVCGVETGVRREYNGRLARQVQKQQNILTQE